MLEIEEQLRRHAAWVRPQMPPLASAVDPSASGGDPSPPGRRPRPSRRAWVAVATAAAVVVAAATIAVVASRTATPPAASPRPNRTATVAPGPDTALVPPARIGNLELWSLTSAAASDPGTTSATRPGPTSTAATIARDSDGSYQQLFGQGGQPRLEIQARKLLAAEASGLGTMRGAGIAQVSQPIRGGNGRLQSARFAPGVQAAPAGQLTPMALIWREGGFEITATFRGLSSSQALAFVDTLQVGHGTVAAGFEAPAGSDLAPLELPSSADAPTGLVLNSRYATGTDGAGELDVSTCPPGAGCSGSYADVWIWGSRLADGSVEGELSSYGAPPSSYERVWPDGQDVEVNTYAAGEIDLELARQIADGVALGDRAQVVALQTQVSDRLLALPRVAAASFDTAAVEVHRDGRLTAVCLAPSGQSLSCPSATFSDPATPPTGGFDASVLSGGRWIVAAAIQASTPFGYYPDTSDIGSAGGKLPAPIAGRSAPGLPEGSGWEIGLVQVPDGVDNIVVTQTSGGSFGGSGVSRPTG
jgi:hypothetical protein